MRSVWRLSPIAVAVSVAAFTLAPGHSVLHASAAAGHASHNLSSAQGVNQYLTSIGINPSKAIHQTGTKNYAGPDCPGAGWNCTTSKNAVVVQLALANGVNVFQCTPASGGTNAATDTCVVVQVASGANNVAVCKESATNTAPSPSCSITQTNTTGKNTATVNQQWSWTAGDTQTAAETATVSQQNGSGENNADVKQGIAQYVKDAASLQDQEATQYACIQQDSPSGADIAQIRQTTTQNEQATATPVTQFQNQNPGSNQTCGSVTTLILPNLAGQIEQDQGSAGDTGQNSANLQQSLHQKQLSSKSTGTVTQQQGSNNDNGGMEGNVNQTSTGLATATADQNGNQLEDAETSGSLTQNQNDPARCCSNQASNPNDTFKLTQEKVLSADAGASQFYDVEGICDSSGSCNVHQTIMTNSESFTDSCTTSPCFLFHTNEGG